MADLPGDPARPAIAVSGALKMLVPAVGALLALSAALAAACFVKAFGITFLGRPAATRRPSARTRADRFSLAAMFALAALCLLAGVLPGLFIDALGAGGAAGRRRADAGADRASPGSRSCPIAESRSSYNGLLVFLFIVASASLAAAAIHRFASDAVRRAPAWDCGFPDAEPGHAIYGRAVSPSRSGACSAASLSAPASEVDMPAPGRHAAGALQGRDARPDLGSASTLPIVGAVADLAAGSTGCSSSPSGNI